jgi:hypothetical protein
MPRTPPSTDPTIGELRKVDSPEFGVGEPDGSMYPVSCWAGRSETDMGSKRATVFLDPDDFLSCWAVAIRLFPPWLEAGLLETVRGGAVTDASCPTCAGAAAGAGNGSDSRSDGSAGNSGTKTGAGADGGSSAGSEAGTGRTGAGGDEGEFSGVSSDSSFPSPSEKLQELPELSLPLPELGIAQEGGSHLGASGVCDEPGISGANFLPDVAFAVTGV